LTAHEAPLRTVVLYRSELPAELERAFRAASTDAPLLSLARALASSRVWHEGCDAVLVARPEPTPALVAIGRFRDADEARLSALHEQLRSVLPRTLVLDYGQVEAGAALLAERLRQRVGEPALAHMRFVGVPRGGMIVLGMLAYALDLPRHRLDVPDAGAAPSPEDALVVVDDSVISGLRLAQFLERRPEQHIVIASLYAHPDLRAAFRARDARVRAFVSAYDLHDHAPAAHGPRYEGWRDRWRERSDPRSVWVGQPEHVCLPWGEPEISAWNPVTEREELGWNLIPPELCLEHRCAPSPGALTAQLQAPVTSGTRPAAHVVYGDLGGEIVISDLDALETFALDGIAAEMWRALMACADEDAAASAVARTFDVDQRTALEDIGAFVGELRAAGLVEEGA